MHKSFTPILKLGEMQEKYCRKKRSVPIFNGVAMYEAQLI